jgi:hypothetical protein
MKKGVFICLKEISFINLNARDGFAPSAGAHPEAITSKKQVMYHHRYKRRGSSSPRLYQGKGYIFLKKMIVHRSWLVA